MKPSDSHTEEVKRIRDRLKLLDSERAKLKGRLVELTERPSVDLKEVDGARIVTNRSPTRDKIALFRTLFAGRVDVYPRRWENVAKGRTGYAPVCANEWKHGLCRKPAVSCGLCSNQKFLPVTDATIESHLRGHATIGIYPMLPDDTCRFLAADFDKRTWYRDADAFLAACKAKDVPAALERSRSGNGAHVWIFFQEPVPAGLARRLGTHLLTEAMDRYPDIGFRSYDRFFPSQDTMPQGGFGNLIAMPLQGGPRKDGNSLFLDDNMEPWPDQWAFMSGLRRLATAHLAEIVEDADRKGLVVGLRLPAEDDDPEPWTLPPSRRRPQSQIIGALPDRIDAVIADQIYIEREGIPPALVNRIIRLAAFQNPAFFAAQAMRRSTYGTPRVIACAELFSKHIALPRGNLEALRNLLQELRIDFEIRDERVVGQVVRTSFLGKLTAEQLSARTALLANDTGVLSATTAFGKTVVAASLVAARARSTLVLVHRRQLLDQWKARLNTFLDLPTTSIGQVGGGKRKPTGIVDIAIIQSLVRADTVDDIVADYGQVIVDECHHLSAVSFERVARRAKARYFLGLSATVTRRDGHHPIVFMQCGPVRFRANAKAQAMKRPFLHRALLRKTEFQFPAETSDERPPIHAIYSALATDETRNDLIFDDILSTLEAGRSPLVLTARIDHAQYFSDRLSRFAKNVLFLRGGMGAKQFRGVMERLETIPDTEERVLVATGRYIGEGFDDARLDTLFLAMPVAWRETLAQYVGRLHRLYPEKREVLVFDYVDDAVPTLRRMAEKRVSGYRNLGYSVVDTAMADMSESSGNRWN
ncbi:MAG: DEAD/DEAH box helicase family protein [Rhodobacter sp.]|nr:DEAD/DEAH box helicase family protein [Rhodobacter sp.]